MEKTTKKEMGHNGLCVNCIHKGTCTLPKCEGGKVHCEEYACM